MIRWGEERRDKDPAYFCQLAVVAADKPVWLVCDARRPSDMDFFTTLYSTITVSNCHTHVWILDRICLHLFQPTLHVLPAHNVDLCVTR